MEVLRDPHPIPPSLEGGRVKKGEKNEQSKMKDSMIIDGLIDVYNQYHMGVTAENVAEKYQITRKQQDEFAVKSQMKAAEAIKTNKFKDEIVPISFLGS